MQNMAWLIRLAKLVALGVLAYYVVGYIAAIVVAIALVALLLLSESAVLGD